MHKIYTWETTLNTEQTEEHKRQITRDAELYGRMPDTPMLLCTAKGGHNYNNLCALHCTFCQSEVAGANPLKNFLPLLCKLRFA